MFTARETTSIAKVAATASALGTTVCMCFAGGIVIIRNP